MVIGKLRQISDKSRMFDAIGNSFGIIGFKPDGTIIDANDSFLRLTSLGQWVENGRGTNGCKSLIYNG